MNKKKALRLTLLTINLTLTLARAARASWLPWAGTGTLPDRAHPTDAGLDLHAAHETYVPAEGTKTINTNIQVAIPSGHVGLVCPRSGLAANNGITVLNAPGIVDSGYRGDVQVILHNTTKFPYRVGEGDRVAQLVITPIIRPVPTSFGRLPSGGRGAAGLGSTGR